MSKALSRAFSAKHRDKTHHSLATKSVRYNLKQAHYDQQGRHIYMSQKVVGDKIKAANAGWSFAGEVCENFDQHVLKSVPFYEEGHTLITQLSDYFLNDQSLCYDIGCSTGTLLNKIAHRCEKSVQFIGYDRETTMIEKAKLKREDERICLHCDELMNVEFEKADLIISYYTMQFVPPKHRQILFDRIYQALNWGGAFVMFEKVRGPDARFQDLTSSLYTEYKLEQGFSAEEIVAKSRSLKGILEPFSSQGNLDLLARAGFVDVISIMKYVCFEGFLAIK